jgi:protein-disulfide isomerase
MKVKILLVLCLAGLVAAAGCHGSRQLMTVAPSAPRADVLAVVNGREITEKEVDERVGSQLYGLQHKLYQLRRNALKSIIDDQLLKEAARARGVSEEELRKELTPAVGEVSQEQIDAVYATRAGQFVNVEETAAKQQIKARLENHARLGRMEKYLADLRKQGGVEVFLQPPNAPLVNVGSEGPAKGSPQAAVVIVEFSDFECPACKKASVTLGRVAAEYADRVRIVYRHLPLSIHKQAIPAAQASVCADRQGKFWEMHDLLFAAAKGLSDDALRGYASQLGLDARSFGDCMASKESRAIVLQDQQAANDAGIRSTPTFVINGKLIQGGMSGAELKSIIERELRGGEGAR